MYTRLITDTEIEDLKVSSLPSRPTAPKSFGGKGYTASEMKAAFDRLPLLIINRFNTLFEDIRGGKERSVAGEIRTFIKEDHTLLDLFNDITSGEFASYASFLGENLSQFLLTLRTELDTVKAAMGDSYPGTVSFSIDCGSPLSRLGVGVSE